MYISQTIFHTLLIRIIVSGKNGIYTIELTVFSPNKAVGRFLKATDQIIYTNGSPLKVINNLDNLKTIIYPNPFTSKLTVLLDQKDLYQIKIFSINGKLILNKETSNTNEIKLNLSSLTKGQYIIQSQNHLITEKIIKLN